MARIVLFTAVIGSLAFAALAAAMTALSAYLPADLPADLLVLCEQRICWHTIIPGLTTIHDASARLKRERFVLAQRSPPFVISFDAPQHSRVTRASLMYYNSSTVDTLVVTLDEQFTLGDVITAAGSPDGMTHLGRDLLPAYHLGDGLLVVSTAAGELSPYAGGVQLLYTAPEAQNPLRAWHGFVPHWRYCQLEPGAAC
jgi:hypothetical protein